MNMLPGDMVFSKTGEIWEAKATCNGSMVQDGLADTGLL